MRQDRAGEVIASYYGIDLHKDQITWHCIHKTGNGEINWGIGNIDKFISKIESRFPKVKFDIETKK